MVERRGGSLNKEVEWRPLYGGTQGGKFKKRNRMETIVWCNAGGEVYVNKEIEWRPLYGGTQGGKFK